MSSAVLALAVSLELAGQGASPLSLPDACRLSPVTPRYTPLSGMLPRHCTGTLSARRRRQRWRGFDALTHPHRTLRLDVGRQHAKQIFPLGLLLF